MQVTVNALFAGSDRNIAAMKSKTVSKASTKGASPTLVQISSINHQHASTIRGSVERFS
jgi:hypothetical protein